MVTGKRIALINYGAMVMTQFHDLSMASITGELVDFADYKNKVCLVVNVASQ